MGFVRAKVETIKEFNIDQKELRQKLNLIHKMMTFGVDQITATFERSDKKCGRFNLIVFITAENRLQATDIARLYQYLANNMTPGQISIED